MSATPVERCRALRFLVLFFLLAWVPMWLGAVLARAGAPAFGTFGIVVGGLGVPVAALLILHFSHGAAQRRNY
ncbi:MAG: hypothetical protein ACYC5O_12685 [Anaerolineae bacterium]